MGFKHWMLNAIKPLINFTCHFHGQRNKRNNKKSWLRGDWSMNDLNWMMCSGWHNASQSVQPITSSSASWYNTAYCPLIAIRLHIRIFGHFSQAIQFSVYGCTPYTLCSDGIHSFLYTRQQNKAKQSPVQICSKIQIIFVVSICTCVGLYFPYFSFNNFKQDRRRHFVIFNELIEFI